MRRIRHLVLLAGLLVTGLPVLVAAPATAAETWTTQVTVTAAPPAAVYGTTLSIEGELATLNPSDQKYYYVDGQTLVLERRLAGQPDFVAVDEQATGYDGTVTFDVKPYKNAQYKLTYAGGAYDEHLTLSPSESAAKSLKVFRNLHERTFKKSGKIHFAGNVDPGWGGKTIYLQKKACGSCAWKAYAKQKTTSSGAWNFVTPAPNKGEWKWRTYVPATTDYQKTVSAVLKTYKTYF